MTLHAAFAWIRYRLPPRLMRHIDYISEQAGHDEQFRRVSRRAFINLPHASCAPAFPCWQIYRYLFHWAPLSATFHTAKCHVKCWDIGRAATPKKPYRTGAKIRHQRSWRCWKGNYIDRRGDYFQYKMALSQHMEQFPSLFVDDIEFWWPHWHFDWMMESYFYYIVKSALRPPLAHRAFDAKEANIASAALARRHRQHHASRPII